MRSLDSFRQELGHDGLLDRLRGGLLGRGVSVALPYGILPLLYADDTASGRALRQVEDWIAENLLPFYANTHTEASFCGAYTSRLREDARREIARLTGAGPDCSVIFTSSGATAAVNKLTQLLDVAGAVMRGKRAVVLIGPYEHHSNILPWRESGAEVIAIPEAAKGGPDMGALESALKDAASTHVTIGAFSAASNVTGILTDADAVTRLLNRYGASPVWDYAAAAPYLDMDMGFGATAKQALFFSPHKFPGGPGASGVLVVRNAICQRDRPTQPGGGTVDYVNATDQDYSASLIAREEAGTPNVPADVRAALVMLIRDALGQDTILKRDHELRQRALRVWQANPNIELLGDPTTHDDALPIFAFRVRDADTGGHIHHQLFTRILSDVCGIQARGGCACAGPYGHRLLGIDERSSKALRQRIKSGQELAKPGWIRLNVSHLMTDEEADTLIAGVDRMASEVLNYKQDYTCRPNTAHFENLKGVPQGNVFKA